MGRKASESFLSNEGVESGNGCVLDWRNEKRRRSRGEWVEML